MENLNDLFAIASAWHFGWLLLFAVGLFFQWRRRKRLALQTLPVPTLSSREPQPITDLPGLGTGSDEDVAQTLRDPPHIQDTDPDVVSFEPPLIAEGVDPAWRRGLAKTHESIFSKLQGLFSRATEIDAGVLDALEEILLTADVGVRLSMRWMDDLRGRLSRGELKNAEDVRAALRALVLATLEAPQSQAMDVEHLIKSTFTKPYVIMFVGVNGVGKTTTIGKMASKLTKAGLQVVVGAGDTFRAAAAEQLAIWAERSGSVMIRGEEGTDPASVIFNAISHARTIGADVVLADTAGRLHTKTELMDEIRKVKKAAGKARDNAPDEVWLVVDGTTGQNALLQAKEFHDVLALSGIVLTKLDGTAKGGVVIAIADALNIPVRYVGVGETVDDLKPFVPKAFVAALFEEDSDL